jgi:hypothetical protein
MGCARGKRQRQFNFNLKDRISKVGRLDGGVARACRQEGNVITDGQQRLPETLAKQVLARAAQLDASDRMSVSVADLRTAAVEAGISPSALDQALREIAALSVAEASSAHGRRARSRRRRVFAAVALVIVVLGATLGVLREAPAPGWIEDWPEP